MKYLLTPLLYLFLFAANIVSYAQSFNIEPEQIVFDFYVAGQPYGNVLVTYTDSWVQINHPKDALDQMPTVKDKDLFKSLMEQQIPVPLGREKENVGRISADPNFFRINVEINRLQLVESAIKKGTVAPPVRHVALKNDLRITGRKSLEEGVTNDRTNNTFSHTTTLSKGRWRAEFSGSKAENSQYDFATYSLEHDVSTRTYSFGMLQTEGTMFASSQNFLGVKLESNYRPLGSLREYESTPVEVYVPSRARVNIYRNETELLFSDIYEFGIHRIPTGRFPQGSYDLRIEIEEDSGTVTEERRVFARSSNLEAFDHPEYEFSLGLDRDGTEIGTSPVFQASVLWRVLDEMDMKASFYTDGDLYLFEPKIQGVVGLDYDYDIALSMTTEQDIAFRTNLFYNPTYDNQLNWNIGLTHMLSGHDGDAPRLDVAERDNFLASNLASKRTSLLGNISYRQGDITWRYGVSYNKNNDAEYTFSHGPAISWQAYRSGPHSITTSARLIRNRDTSDYSMLASYRYIPTTYNDWSGRSEISRSRRAGDELLSSLNTISFNNQDETGIGTEFNATSRHIFESTSSSRAAELTLAHGGKHVDARVGYSRQSGSGNDSKDETLNYSLNSQFVITRDPLETKDPTALDITSVAGNVIIELHGNATGTEMFVTVNGRPVASGFPGETITLSIPDYQTSNIGLEPALESSIVYYDQQEESVTAYPENIFRKKWRVDKMTLLLGRLIDVNGQPVEWQRINGIHNFATTDGQGNFQIEVLGNEMPYVDGSQNRCTMALPNVDQGDTFKYIGDIVCS